MSFVLLNIARLSRETTFGNLYELGHTHAQDGKKLAKVCIVLPIPLLM